RNAAHTTMIGDSRRWETLTLALNQSRKDLAHTFRRGLDGEAFMQHPRSRCSKTLPERFVLDQSAKRGSQARCLARLKQEPSLSGTDQLRVASDVGGYSAA